MAAYFIGRLTTGGKQFHCHSPRPAAGCNDSNGSTCGKLRTNELGKEKDPLDEPKDDPKNNSKDM